MYIAGLRTGGCHFNGKSILMSAELPPGTHMRVRFARCPVQRQRRERSRYPGHKTDAEDRALAVPEYDASAIQNAGMDQSGVARPSSAAGCTLSPLIFAGDSSASTISVYDLAANQRLLSVNLTMDVRNAITAWRSGPRLNRCAGRPTGRHSGRLRQLLDDFRPNPSSQLPRCFS